MFGIPWWAWLLGGGAGLYFMSKRNKGSTADDVEVLAFVDNMNKLRQQVLAGAPQLIVTAENVSDSRGRVWTISVQGQSDSTALWKQGGEWYVKGEDATGPLTLSAPTLPALFEKLKFF